MFRRLPIEAHGQSTVEWIGLVLLVTALMAGLTVAGARVPALGLVHSISKQMLCAASLSGYCDREPSLDLAYGESAADLVRRNTPDLFYGRDLLGLPVDYRTCRSPYCAEAAAGGELRESLAGEPVTLFTRVLDCRALTVRTDPAADCDGERAGFLYVQYWAYYPESASLRGVPVLEVEGYHRNDWESVQVRIGPDGEVSQRASSHSGHNHDRSFVNWGSDIGWGFLSGAAEELGLREPGGWGERTGRYLIAGGSHAGNVDGDDLGNYPGHTPARYIHLVPLEIVRSDPIARPARFDPITPPWEKRLWRDPEEPGTG
ncbi:MAG: hypothetical protein JJE13_00695 [Thermoleophilia bacterium]|nr:hypothetical protein [Thermoleophilia bacterium]